MNIVDCKTLHNLLLRDEPPHLSLRGTLRISSAHAPSRSNPTRSVIPNPVLSQSPDPSKPQDKLSEESGEGSHDKSRDPSVASLLQDDAIRQIASLGSVVSPIRSGIKREGGQGTTWLSLTITGGYSVNVKKLGKYLLKTLLVIFLLIQTYSCANKSIENQVKVDTSKNAEPQSEKTEAYYHFTLSRLNFLRSNFEEAIREIETAEKYDPNSAYLKS